MELTPSGTSTNKAMIKQANCFGNPALSKLESKNVVRFLDNKIINARHKTKVMQWYEIEPTGSWTMFLLSLLIEKWK